MLAIVARAAAEAFGAEQCQIQEQDTAGNTVMPVDLWQRHTDRPEPESLHKVLSLDDESGEPAYLESRPMIQ